MNQTVKSLLKKGYYAYESVTNKRFYDLKKKTNGMLWPIVYKKMYELCCELPDLDIVEVGGATGAGSISIAWAMKDSGKSSRLIVVEKCEGGSRNDVGDYTDNLDLIKKHFESLNAHEKILLFPHEITFENGDKVKSLIETKEIGAFIHDADGRIDRDFYLFWPVLKQDGLIIVDDYANEPKYKPVSDRHPQGGIKSVVTYRLLNQMIEWGLFKPYFKIGKTIFGYKPADADFSKFDLQTCEKIIEEIQSERREMLNI